eukprot:7126529-Prymnesium_polylepis.2
MFSVHRRVPPRAVYSRRIPHAGRVNRPHCRRREMDSLKLHATLKPMPGMLFETPLEPAQIFQLLFGAWILLAHAYHRAELHRFYDKWSSERLSYSTLRGLGSAPCRLYGLFRVPSLQPFQLRLASVAFSLGVAVSCHPTLANLGCWAAFVAYHAYFPQLYASRISGGHTSILIPAVFFISGCCPANSDWSIPLLRIYVASAYCSSGLEKIASSVRLGTYWGRGETLQFYIYEVRCSDSNSTHPWSND